MKKRDDGSQLTLDLVEGSKMEKRQGVSGRVMPFIDAATLETRRTALRRVEQSGIFSLPPNLRVR